MSSKRTKQLILILIIMNVLYFIRDNYTDVEFNIESNEVSFRLNGIKLFAYIKPIYGCSPNNLNQ